MLILTTSLYFWMFSFSSDRQFSFSEWNTTFWPLVNCQSIRKLIMRKLFLALWQKCNSFWCKKSSFIHYLLRQVQFSSFSFNKKKHKPFMDSCQSPHISPWKSQHSVLNGQEHVLQRKSRYVFRVAKYHKKSFQHLTILFMSTWWGDSKNMQEIEFSRWLFELPAK